MRGSNLLALRCSQLPSFPKVISHKVVNNVLHILTPMPGKKAVQYVTQAKTLRLKDLMSLIAQMISAIMELNKLGIIHYVISLKSVYLTAARRICITEVLPDVSPFISYNDAMGEVDGVQFPPEAWEAVSYTHLTLPTICSV
eukprot:TRINITY_DN3305_c0_g1_i12.p1 TRINITY_DN3305_c0_g1~~TRINITY_DN3305_c0_g1_i12.p1  ORF type:complete len:142 (+),score=37.60 TRINITY_DN3305_c0_g1_i12:161-586(+)